MNKLLATLLVKIISLAFVDGAAFYGATVLACRAGEGRNVSFLGAKMGGYFLAFIGTTILIPLFKIKRAGKMLFFYFVSIVGVAALYRSSPKVMLSAYAAGFEKTALSVASPAQWLSVVPIVKTWSAAHSVNSIDNALPAFTRNVYPNNPPYSGLYSDDPPANSSNVCVIIFWRGVPNNIGLRIGPFGQTGDLLYQKTITNGLSIVIWGGGG